MKKGIETHIEYDKNSRWTVVITKKKGKLTLDEIKEAAREVEWDYYLLVLDCYHDEHEEVYGCDYQGDTAVLYRTDLFYEEGER